MLAEHMNCPCMFGLEQYQACRQTAPRASAMPTPAETRIARNGNRSPISDLYIHDFKVPGIYFPLFPMGSWPPYEPVPPCYGDLTTSTHQSILAQVETAAAGEPMAFHLPSPSLPIRDLQGLEASPLASGLAGLPGGYFQTILEPGDYTLEVWAPDRSPKWQPLPYSIRAGQLAHVDCLPP